MKEWKHQRVMDEIWENLATVVRYTSVSALLNLNVFREIWENLAALARYVSVRIHFW